MKFQFLHTIGKPKTAAKKDSFSLMNVTLSAFFFALILYMMYLNFSKLNPWNLNSDIVNEISYRQASWEQHTLYPEGFVGPAYSLACRPVFIYWIFYGITHNFLLSYQLENLCTFLLELWAMDFFMKKLELRKTVRLLSLCMYIGFLPACHQYVLFNPGNFYALFAVVIWLTLALRTSVWKHYTGLGSLRTAAVWIPLGIILMFSLVFGSTTIQLAILLYIPLFCVDMFRIILKYIWNKSIDHKEVCMLSVSGMSMGINVTCYAILTKFHSAAFNRPQFIIGSIASWLDWSVISNQINSLLLSFGIDGGGSLMSVSGIRFAASCCVVVVELLSVIWLLKKAGRQYERSAHNELIWFWLAATAVVCVEQIVTAQYIESVRYYVATGILLPVISGAAIDGWSKAKMKQSVGPIALCVLIFFSTSIKQDIERFAGTPPDLTQVAAYIEENEYDYVTASYYNAGIIKGYTNGVIESQHSSPYIGSIASMTPFPFNIDKRKFEQERIGEQNILLLTDDEESQIINDRKYSYFMLRDYAEKEQEIGCYNLYMLTENPFTLIKKIEAQYTAGLPSINQKEKRDYPDSVGFLSQVGTLNNQRELTSDGLSEGYMLYGPYTDSIPGNYNITLHYAIESYAAEEKGIFGVAYDGKTVVVCDAISRETDSVTLENVVLEEGHTFEVQVWVPVGMVLRVQYIQYDRLEE